MKAKTIKEVQTIVDSVDIGKELYQDSWRFRLLEKGDGFLLQLVYLEPDAETGVLAQQNARKWYISPYSTETEIVETAVCRSLMHRAKEWFTYKEQSVFNPHFDIKVRHKVAEAKLFDTRDS